MKVHNPDSLQKGSKLSRREFIKFGGGGLLALGLNTLGVRPDTPELPNVIENGFYTHVDSYEASSWVAANMAIAAARLNGYQIPAGGEFSMVSALGLDTDKLDPTNTNPNHGYVMGYVNS